MTDDHEEEGVFGYTFEEWEHLQTYGRFPPGTQHDPETPEQTAMRLEIAAALEKAIPETWRGSYWLDKFKHIEDPAEQFIAMVDAGAPNSALRDVQALNPDMFKRYFETHEYENPWCPTHSRFRPTGLE